MGAVGTLNPVLGLRLVNTRKAAEIAEVTERTIRNWVKANKVEFYRTPGGAVRIVADSLLLDPEDE